MTYVHVWRIGVGNDVKSEPIYIWNAREKHVPLEADWAWDTEGTVWSTGNSARRLRSTLTYREAQRPPRVLELKDENGHVIHTYNNPRWDDRTSNGWYSDDHKPDDHIYWLTRVTYNATGDPSEPYLRTQYQRDYPASKVTKRDDASIDYPAHFIRHTGRVWIEFTPAAPYFERFTFYVDFEDYLNYYYMTFPYRDEGTSFPFFKDDPVDAPTYSQLDTKTIDWAGKWVLWHSSRLEEGEPWTVPGYSDETGNFDRAAVTVLSCMPVSGHTVTPPQTFSGNMYKGRGCSAVFGGEPPEDYEPREPIAVPMFLGPGTIRILRIVEEKIQIDLKVITEIYIPYTSKQTVNNSGEWVSIPVQSILKNFEDAYEWTQEDWDTDKGLITERPFNAAGEYYEGQIVPGGSGAPYIVNEIKLNADWLAEAQVSGTKCAIVFVMGYGAKEVTLQDFINLYSEHTAPPENFYLSVIVDKAHVVAASPGDIVRGNSAFTFKAGYQYIIDPDEAEGDPLQLEFEEHEFRVTIPWTDTYYQFTAMIYRIVPDTETEEEGNYKIDPTCPYPIEYWYGITTPTADGNHRRLWSANPYTPTANPAEPGEREQAICTKTSLDKADRISSLSGLIGVSDTTHVRVRVTVPSTADERDLPPEGSYIRFYLHDIETGENIWSDAMIRLPTTAGGSVSREILFLVRKYTEGKKYQVYRQLYASTGEKIGAPRAVGDHLTGTKQYLINSLTMEVDLDNPDYPDYPVVNMSDLEMPYAPLEASYYYSFTIRTKGVTPPQTYTENLANPCHPSKFAWTLPLPDEDFKLADSTTYDLILSIYGESTRANTLTQYYHLYSAPHYITSFTVTDVFAERHPDDPQFLDNEVKVQFKFHATTRLPAGDTTYSCQIWLYRYADVAPQPDTPLPEPERVMHWDFASITNVFEEVPEPIELDLEHSTYRLSLQLIEKASPHTKREIYYTTWETPRQMASGWITGAGKQIRISTPSRFPSEQHAEYRMLRDGVLGTVESPWEMRTESVIGGNAVTRPAWIVRPRVVSFRIMVTAPADQMPLALHSLIEVLTSAPTKGVELQLQTTDRLHQLSIFGYIQVGSPKIEIREDTVTIVSVALDCPNYAWKGHTEMIQLTGSRSFEFMVPGHLPPSVDIWILKSSAPQTELTINGNDPLIINPSEPSYNYIHVHHNPIVQDYYIELAKSLPPTIPEITNTGRSCILRSHPPLSAHSILLGDEAENVIETQRVFELIQPGSYLPLILEPSQSNTIKVTEGRLVLIEYVPHYAFWW